MDSTPSSTHMCIELILSIHFSTHYINLEDTTGIFLLEPPAQQLPRTHLNHKHSLIRTSLGVPDQMVDKAVDNMSIYNTLKVYYKLSFKKRFNWSGLKILRL